MAKLKVGDIIIENGNMTIHGPRGPVPALSSDPSQAVRGTNSTLNLLRRLPIQGGYLIAGGLGVVIVSLRWGSPLPWLLWPSPVAYLLGGTPLCLLGFGVAALGVAKIIMDKKPLPTTEDDNHILAQRIARLRPLLATLSPINTVEHLAQATGMTEEAVIDTLFIMQKKDMIEEDLNFDNAEWYYYLSRKEEKTKHMTLEQRRSAQH